MPATEVEDDDAWALEARHLALGLVAAISVLSPERIVVGGGASRNIRACSRSFATR